MYFKKQIVNHSNYTSFKACKFNNIIGRSKYINQLKFYIEIKELE